MTRKVVLSDTEIDAICNANETACKSIPVDQRITDATSFVFFAAFDGTNNDKDNVPRGELSTNVGQLWTQYQRQNRSSGSQNRFGGGYYKGPGAPGTLSESSWLPPQVKEQVILTAENAYHDFCQQASSHGDTSTVVVVLTSFSRGGASAAIFAQMLYERGLIHPATKTALVPPKQVAVVGGVLFDPVMTGVNTTLAYPPNVSDLLVLRALNEYRYLFYGADYSKYPESAIRTKNIYGNHCDIGGGYDNGIAGLTLATATEYLKSLGLSIGSVPPERQYVRSQVCVHTEEYDNYGHKIWDVSNEDGFSFADYRHMTDVGSPASPDINEKMRFLVFNGDVVYC